MFSFRKILAFWRPWPIRCPSYENQAPDFSTIPADTPKSSNSPIFDMPSPYMISNSIILNGGAILFLTTLTRVWFPTTSSRSLIAPIRRCQGGRSNKLQRIAARCRFRAAEHHTDLHAIWFIKITMQRDRLIEPVNFRKAWLIRRACNPTCVSPISPSSSAEPRRQRNRQPPQRRRSELMSEISRPARPHLAARSIPLGHRPEFLAELDLTMSASTVHRNIGLRLQYMQCQRGLTRTFRPINLDNTAPGKSADTGPISRPREPVETASISTACSRWPSFIIDPLPKDRSICPSAASRLFLYPWCPFRPGVVG